ncbi:MAG: hypothetical protein UDB11_00635 [Peptococcaceae bacterium]|nr:hypothetical protein [Peptococcaceae bacterium]
MAVKVTLDDAAAVKELQKIAKKSEKAMTRTVSDIKSRAPGWIAKGIAKDYGLSSSQVKDKAKLTITGSNLGTLELKYSGGLLSPSNFKMSPDKPKPGAYTIKATIKRGKRATIGRVKKINKRQRKQLGQNFQGKGRRTSPSSPPMLQTTGAKRVDATTHIPFQRTKYGGSTSGGPMDHVIKTLSVPQMIKDGDGNLKPGVAEKFNEGIEKRFNHHTDQILK